MDPIEGEPVLPLKTIIRTYVEAALAAHPEIPRYRLALELGISPTTLHRMLREWKGGESVMRDRR